MTLNGSPNAVLIRNPFLRSSPVRSTVVDMRDYAAGAGTAASPFTGWESIVPVANTTYLFAAGTWQFTTWPNFSLHGVRLIGASGYGTILQHIGTGDAVSFSTTGSHLRGIEMRDFRIRGTVLTTNALVLQKVASSQFTNIRAGDCTAAGIVTKGVVGIEFSTVRVSSNEPGGFSPQPAEGIVLDSYTTIPSTTVTVINGLFEGVSGSGVHIKQAHDIRFFGGVSEGNARGLEIDAYAGAFPTTNYFNMDLEANTVDDALVKGPKNTFVGCHSSLLFRLSGGTANDNVIIGGSLWNLTIDAGALRNVFMGVNVSNTLTDNGTDTVFSRLFHEPTATYHPNTIPGRVLVTGAAPAVSGATGLGSGSAAIVATSTDHAGYVHLFPAGAPSASGEFVVTLATAHIGGDPPAIFATLVNGSPGTWDTGATVTIQSAGLASFKVMWNNNGVALTAPGATYRVAYQVVGMK